MKRLLWVAAALAALGIAFVGVVVLALVLLTPLPTIIAGWMAGEGFHDGRPTSYWINALKAPDVKTRRSAVQALERIGPEAEEAVPALCTALEDENWEVRFGAALALGEIGKRPEAAIPALEKMMQSPTDGERRRAITGIGLFGPDAKAAIPSLLKALDDESPNVRGGAAWALGRIGPDAHPAFDKLRLMISDKEAYESRPYVNRVGEMVCAALWKIDANRCRASNIPFVDFPWDRGGKDVNRLNR